MLLTITYSGQNTAELGYLLHKNPFRPQRFDLSYGAAYVFYPHVSEPVSPPIEKTTAAILLDINPVDLARGKTGSGGVDYVNDRPYAASSFLSVAIAKVFGTAMGGRADNHQTLSDSPLDLDADIAMLPCRGNPAMIKRVFEPLGYEVSWESFDADENFPSWGKSDYVNLKIKGKIRLRDLLKHIYVLIPVFDRQKHYYIGEDEVEKLLRYAEDWLPSHPEREYITGRYLKRLRPLVNKAFARLVCADERSGELADDGEASVEMTECKLNLNAQRLDSVIAELKRSDANSVIDIGCGEGNLLRLLVKERRFARIGGMDVSHLALKRAAEKLGQAGEGLWERLALFQSSVTYKDSRLKGYDAACIIEVIEHLDLPRLSAFERVVFEYAKPSLVILTTPNREYNTKYENIYDGNFRHGDHRFEWTRDEFRQWAERVATRYGYGVRFSEIGEADAALGAATQMGVFRSCE